MEPVGHVKPIVAVDIDEVLAQFIPTLAKFHNDVFGGVELTASSFVSYEFHHVWGGTKEECSVKVGFVYTCHVIFNSLAYVLPT
jgi:hypothetical protein